MINSNLQDAYEQYTSAGQPYALIAPCRTEFDCIASTLQAVMAKTARPKSWVIVSDGSAGLQGQKGSTESKVA
jgi:hypothetical protein